MRSTSFLNYVAALAIITVLTGLIYVTAQQLYRANANDPQVQLARDLAHNLQQGKSIESLLVTDSIDISKSLGVFTVLFDADGKAIRSSGFLEGQTAQLPKGIFDAVKTYGEHRVTWQPYPGLRVAMVVVIVNTPLVAYVAVGRSLKEVEEGVGKMTSIPITGWIVCVTVLSINYGFYLFNKRNT